MDFDLTQAIPLSDVESDGTDDLEDVKRPVAYVKVIKQEGFPETSYPIYNGVNLIGRGDTANVIIPLKALSKEHACIEAEGESIFLYDKGSKNKTRRGKCFLKPNVRYAINDKDLLTFGDVKCQFVMNHDKMEVVKDDIGIDSDSGSETDSECLLQMDSAALIPPTTIHPFDNTKPGSDISSNSSHQNLKADKPSCVLVEESFLEYEEKKDSSTFVPDTQPTLDASYISDSSFLRPNVSLIDDTFNSEADDADQTETQKYDVSKEDFTVASTSGKNEAEAVVVDEIRTLKYSDTDNEDDNATGLAPASIRVEEATQRYGEEVDKTDLATAPTLAYTIAEAATQRYCDGDETDEEVEKKDMANAPTQAYTMAEAATQRYCEGDEVDEEVNLAGQATAPTQAYTMAEAATQKYVDGDETDEEVDLAGLATAPTQGYTMAEAATQRYVDGDGTDEEVDLAGLATASTQGYTMAEAATQMYVDGDGTDEEVDLAGLATAPTQGYTLADVDTQKCDEGLDSGDKTVSEVLAAAPTLAYDSNDSETATQAYGTLNVDETKAALPCEKPEVHKNNRNVSPVKNENTFDLNNSSKTTTADDNMENKNITHSDAPTQAFSNNDSTGKTQVSSSKSNTAQENVFGRDDETVETQVFSKDDETAETLVFSKDDEAAETQVFSKDDEGAETQVFSKDDEMAETQVFSKDDEMAETQVFSKDDETAEAQVFNKDDEMAETQVFSKDDETAETQVFNKDDEIAETQVFSKDDEAAETQVFSKDDEMADTQVFSKGDETGEKETGHDSNASGDTQVPDSQETEELETEIALLLQQPPKSSLASPDKKGHQRKSVAFSVPEKEKSEEANFAEIRRSGRSRRLTSKMKENRNSSVVSQHAEKNNNGNKVDDFKQPHLLKEGVITTTIESNKKESAANIERKEMGSGKKSNKKCATKTKPEQDTVPKPSRRGEIQNRNIEYSDNLGDIGTNEIEEKAEERQEGTTIIKRPSRKETTKLKNIEKDSVEGKHVTVTEPSNGRGNQKINSNDMDNGNDVSKSAEIAGIFEVKQAGKKGKLDIEEKQAGTTKETVTKTPRRGRTQLKNIEKEEKVNDKQLTDIEPSKGRRLQKVNINDHDNENNVSKSAEVDNKPAQRKGSKGKVYIDEKQVEITKETVTKTPRKGRAQLKNIEKEEKVDDKQVTDAETSKGEKIQKVNINDPNNEHDEVDDKLEHKLARRKGSKRKLNIEEKQEITTDKKTPRRGRTQLKNIEKEEKVNDKQLTDIEPSKGGKIQKVNINDPNNENDEVDDKLEHKLARRKGSKRKLDVEEKQEIKTDTKTPRRGRAQLKDIEKEEKVEDKPVVVPKPSKGSRIINYSDNECDISETVEVEEICKGKQSRRRESKQKLNGKEKQTGTTNSTVTKTPRKGRAQWKIIDKEDDKQKTEKNKRGRGSKSNVVEDENDDISCSPSLRQRISDSKPRIMFTGVVDESWEKIVNNLGGVLVTSIHDCTHLITDKIRRTVKFLCGLAKGAYLVNPNWLEESKKMKHFVNPDNFMIVDYASERQHGFSLKRSHDLALEMKLYQGYKFHVTSNVKPDTNQMKDIIKCAGGEYVSRMPNKYEEDAVVVATEEDEAKCNAALKAGVPVVSAEFILTGLLRQEFSLDPYRLFTNDESSRKRKQGTSDKKGPASKRKR